MPQCSVSPAALGETRSQRLPCLSSSRLTLSELREGAGERAAASGGLPSRFMRGASPGATRLPFCRSKLSVRAVSDTATSRTAEATARGVRAARRGGRRLGTRPAPLGATRLRLFMEETTLGSRTAVS